MSFCFESLESRRLLSNAAIGTLIDDETTLKAEDSAIVLLDRSAKTEIDQELATNGEVSASIHDFLVFEFRLVKDQKAATSRVSDEIVKINGEVRQLNTIEAELKMYPTNTTLQTKTATVKSTLMSDSSTAQTLIDNDGNTLTSATTTNLSALGTLDSSDAGLQTDISNIESSQSADVTTQQTDANTVFTTDTAAIIASF